MALARSHVHRVLEHARRAPEYPAVLHAGTRLTYGELAERCGALAALLDERGVGPGDRVAILLRPGADVLVSWLAVGSVGATAVFLDPASTPERLERLLGDIAARMVLTEEELGELAAPLAAERIEVASAAAAGRALAPRPVDPGSDAVVWFTSGTTGRPKGVRHTYRSVLAQHRVVEAVEAIVPADRYLCPLPLDAGFGILTIAGVTLYCGASIVLIDRFHPRLAVEAMERYRPTLMAGVPTVYAMIGSYLSENPVALDPLVAWSSGAELDVAVKARFEEATGGRLLGMYGLSELMIAAVEPRHQSHREGSAGRLCPGFEAITIGEDGEPLAPGEPGQVVMRGPSLMDGYLSASDEAKGRVVDGWLHTGDLGYLDEAEHLRITGRISDLIIRGGANVAPAEVEAALRGHPDVLDVAVVGVPDPVFGQKVKACVVPRAGADPDQLEGPLLDYAQRHLGKHKAPEVLAFLPELPRNPVGKVLRRALTDL